VEGAPEISADAFRADPIAVERAFGSECSFGIPNRASAASAPNRARFVALFQPALQVHFIVHCGPPHPEGQYPMTEPEGCAALPSVPPQTRLTALAPQDGVV
jgi:hypothetical protein